MKKQKLSLLQRSITIVAVAVFSLGFSFNTATSVLADRFDEQIRAIQNENAQTSVQRDILSVEAANYQERVSQLQDQINGIQNKIAELDTQRIQTEQAIVQAEAELEAQKDLLGKNIKAMYLEGQITTLEMLATSKDLSEFVDKQEYRDAVKKKISDTVDKITLLKNELRIQKENLERMILDQQHLNREVAAQKTEQQRLLALTEGQKNALNAEIQQNNAQIAELRRQQAAANAARFGSGAQFIVDKSGYPWGGVQPFPNAFVDPWGMYKRQCVSYTAWKVASSGRYMPYWGGRGNANQWDDNARAMGIPVDGNPRPGDVAQSDAGPYGHVMYVEAVYSDGRILVSQYNFAVRGEYSEMVISPNGLDFIHF